MTDLDTSSPIDEMTRGLRRVALYVLTLVVLTAGFANYWEYSKSYHKDPTVFLDVLQGTAVAPNQYRIGILYPAAFIARHSHLGLRHILTMSDIATAWIAAYVLFRLLLRSAVYRSASRAWQWFGAALFVGLVQFYLAWVTWYQRPETLPTAALVALALLLLTVRVPIAGAMGQIATAIGLILLAVAQGFVRADVAFALHLGVILVCLTKAGEGMALPRPMQIATSMVAAGAAAGIQLYMMKVAYPHANYGDTPVFQLLLNVKDVNRLMAFFLFIVPYGWTMKMLLQRRFRASAPAAGLAAGSAIFMGMWWTAGRVEEVRIFLPFALALAPLMVEMAVQRLGLETAD